MSNYLFYFLSKLDTILWDYIAISVILIVGLFLTIYSRFFQFKALFRLKTYINDLYACAEKNKQGVHPIKLYFASVGGMVGLGNIVTVVSTITIGGPGSLVWLWIASFLGMLVKYSEVYLGIKYRVNNNEEGFDGGPMYYLRFAFKNKLLPILVCILLCIYGAEVSQFLIITDTIVNTFSLDHHFFYYNEFKINYGRFIVIILLLFFIFITAVNGVKRFANMCSAMMPIFMIFYVFLGIWIIFDHRTDLPYIFSQIFTSFYNHDYQTKDAVSGGVFLAAHYGISRAVYSGDIGIGYDSIMQSETQAQYPERQARMSIFALLSDSLICSISILVLLVTGVWKMDGLQPSEYIIRAFKLYISDAEYFMAVLFVFAGFTTITGYLVVGQKCAQYLNVRYGKKIYMLYSMLAFVFFSFFSQEQVILVMSVSGGLLMVINIFGVFELRKQIKFS